MRRSRSSSRPPPAMATDYENRLRAGGLGYGDLKKVLFEHYWNYFAAARATTRAPPQPLGAATDAARRVLRGTQPVDLVLPRIKPKAQ